MKQLYLVMGRHDAVVISEAPDDETASRVALTLGVAGAIRTEALRAFAEAEYRKIIPALP